jgi:4'-phosphopantetheinyl transferase EntD
LSLLDPVLVPGVSGAALSDLGQPLFLHPDEEAHVAGAAEKRRRDFALGRACAHAALAEIGRNERAIGRGENGAPTWPEGVVGSITHTQGFAAAIVARARDFAGLGLDAERTGGVTPDLWPRLFGPAERDFLTTASDAALFATILFSAKEACHKAGRERVLRFHELQVMLAEKEFTARRGAETFHGRYAADKDLVLVAAWRR